MNADEVTAYATVGAAVVALVLGIISVVLASRAKREASAANEIAQKANNLSAEANRLVEEANIVIWEQAARQTEHSDVDWEWTWDSTYPDHVIIQNIGKTLATKVVAQFWFGDVREANDASPVDVDGQRVIRFQIPELREARRVAAHLCESTRLLGDKPTPRKARTRLRVTWETPLGTVRHHDTNYQESDLITHADNLNHLVWSCPEGHKYWTRIERRAHGYNCKVCSHRVLVRSVNDLATTDAVLVTEYGDERNARPASTVFAGTEKAWWTCTVAGHVVHQSVPNRRTTRGCLHCPRPQRVLLRA